MPRKKVQGVVKMASFKAWYGLVRNLRNVAKVKMASARIVRQWQNPSRKFFALFADGEDNVVVAFHAGVVYYAVVDTIEAGMIWDSLPEVAGLEVYY